MGDLFTEYEKDFGVLSADIVSKTNKIPNLHGVPKRTLIDDVEQKFDELQELLEQMDLEVRGLPGDRKNASSSRLKSYKDESKTLEQNFKKSKISMTDLEHARTELLAGEDGGQSEDQRSRLLENTERVERSNRRLEEGYRVCIETEELGEEILTNLSRDRENMTRTRDRLRNTNNDLSSSSRILTGMMRRVIQNRMLMCLAILMVLVVICVVIYYASQK
ncbi:vesicle transport through interaction with t-SNAREs homolog 1A-like isoform X2 [Clytia hemisphaerica]|uniref:Vesicle transport through interaction with t-SNAREs homolog 1A n=1 Tax=Clytia hemisphaerica TaxID=252671 RepID=A0A7M5WXF0_9CNID